jgi:glycosyltransferase involved in cell wall biosynthesis
MPKFSVVLIAKNEEPTLPRLMGSLRHFVALGGEVVLVDTGSTDRTVEVAKDLGCRVDEVGRRFTLTIGEEQAKAINARFAVSGDAPVVAIGDELFGYSAARNYAAKLASRDVVAMPDCDESYSALDVGEIDEAIESGVEQLEYSFTFSHDALGRPLIQFMHSKFYDRRKLRWTGVVHEVLSGEARRQYFPPEVIKLEHWQGKSENRGRYLAGLALDCFLNPDNDRNSHYLAREMMYLGRTKSAVAEFKRHVSMGKMPAERAQSMVYLGDCYGVLGIDDQQLRWLHAACDLDHTRREPFIRLAEFYKKKDDALGIACYASAALEIPWNEFYANYAPHYAEVPHDLMYHAKMILGDKEAGEFHYRRALEYDPFSQQHVHDARWFVEPWPSIECLTDWVEQSRPFAFVKLGDGERMCMAGAEGENCDGQPFSPELAEALRKSFSDLIGKAVVVDFSDQCEYNALLHKANCDLKKVKAFWAAVRESKARKVFVGPEKLSGAAELLRAEHVIVDEKNAGWDDDAIYRACNRQIFDDTSNCERGVIVVLCAGMASKIWIHKIDSYNRKSNPWPVTYIDAGSAFDPLFVGQTRTGQATQADLIYLYMDMLPKEMFKKWTDLTVEKCGKALSNRERTALIGSTDPTGPTDPADPIDRVERVNALNGIPKRIFTIWLNAANERNEIFEKCIPTHELPGWEHELITLENCDPEALKSRYVQECLEVKNYVKAADWLRVWYLHKRGGVYLDADMELLPRKDLSELLDCKLLLAMEFKGWVANSVMGSVAGNQLLADYLGRVERNFRGDGETLFDQGMKLLSEMVHALSSEEKQRRGIVVLPTEVFFPLGHAMEHNAEASGATYLTRGVHRFARTWMPLVSICIPTLGREQRLERLLSILEERAEYPRIDVVVERDSFEDRRGCSKTLARAVERSIGELVLFMGNDCVPRPGFVRIAMDCMRKNFPAMDGMVGLNDGVWPNGEVATHWLASKKLLPALDGEFFCTEYRHVACDDELTARVKKMGKYVWCREARIDQEGVLDDVHQLAWNVEDVRHDRSLLEQRCDDLGFRSYLSKGALDCFEQLRAVVNP